jgi:two-component system phosphate regulon response regulator PhoB
MPGTILIVDDERDIVTVLDHNLRREGYQTRVAFNGEEALVRARQEPLPDLVLLDLMLPDLAGTEVCRKLRADERTRHVKIVMLTAKGDEVDRVVGFALGADDYVVKPFSVAELLLRIRAILRRAVPAETESTDVRFGRIRLDPMAHRVWVDGTEVALTALEFRLLNVLISRRGRVQTRDALLTDVWRIAGDVTTRTVDTHVKRLRRKLGTAGEYIETLRGVGYRFRSDPEVAAD